MRVSAASVEDLESRLIGTWLLDKYRIERLLGWGGAAMVFAAKHRNGHRVAVKLLHPAVAEDDSVRARFLQEGYLANHVGHAGAVRVLDDDRLPDGSVFLVMELLEGKTLDARATESEGKLPLKLACDVAYQLLDVLAAAHERGIVHRDIKPQNLFWTDEGRLKVLDFGMACIRDREAHMHITRTGEVFGTPAFMAPEQAIGDMDRVDAASDQWSAAAAVFHLVTAQYVHEARSATEMMVFCATRPARSIREVDPEIPARIGDVLDRALRFHKEERWPHVRDFQLALEHAYQSSFGGRLSMPRIAPATSSIPPLAHSAWSARTLGTRLAVAGTMAAVVTALGILAVRAMVSGSPAKPEVEALAGAPSPGGDAATESGDGAPDELPHAAPLDAMSDPLPETLPARHVAPSASAAPSPSGHQAGPGASPRSGPKPELRKRDPWSAQ